MSYVRMTVYSFDCDHPGGCEVMGGSGWDVLPPQGDGLRAALREIRQSGWTIRGAEHFCPVHKPEGETDAR